MKRLPVYILLFFVLGFTAKQGHSQVNGAQTGAWYMYFWNTNFKQGPWGLQGDLQHRNWNIAGDLEQLLLRGGVTYTPKGTKAMFTLGYGHIFSGDFGDSKDTRQESRIYQEALLPQKIGERFYLKHRFRFEQRFVENQDFRTRFRYNLFVTVPLTQKDLSKGSFYLALYNELFINGQKDIGNGATVELFDRNRAYAALGYSLLDNLKVQAGFMEQTSNSISKGQIQLSLHHRF